MTNRAKGAPYTVCERQQPLRRNSQGRGGRWGGPRGGEGWPRVGEGVASS